MNEEITGWDNIKAHIEDEGLIYCPKIKDWQEDDDCGVCEECY